MTDLKYDFEPYGKPIIIIEPDAEGREVVFVEPRTLRIEPKAFLEYDDAYEYASALSEATGYFFINNDDLWNTRPALTVATEYKFNF